MGRTLERMAQLQHDLSMVSARRRGPIGSVTDLGELAARLGSIVTFDRRGDVYWLDGFEEGIAKWDVDTVGTGAAVGLSGDYARNGKWSCELKAGSDILHFAGISRLFPYPMLSRWGFECHWSFDSDLEAFDIAVAVYDGTNLTSGRLRYDAVNQKLQYLDENGVMQDLATGVGLHDHYNMFNGFKLVVDLEEGEYERAILNEAEYDMEGIALEQSADGHSPVIKLGIRNTGMGGKNGIVYVDDVIVTQNEPGKGWTWGRTLIGVGSG